MDVEQTLTEQFDFDFKLISQANFRVDPLNLEIAKNTFRFFHDKKQSSAITKASKLYGASMSVSGLGRFIQNNKMVKMFRQFDLG